MFRTQNNTTYCILAIPLFG
uniref:Uncharacterized protein n=1 Tax=Anguilla anguilla TaxID=7936 RepID=A0A0E9RQD1_ANGAN